MNIKNSVQHCLLTSLFVFSLILSPESECEEQIPVYRGAEVYDDNTHEDRILQKHSEQLAELQALYREQEEISHSIAVGEIQHRINMAIIDAMLPSDSYYRYEYDYEYD